VSPAVAARRAGALLLPATLLWLGCQPAEVSQVQVLPDRRIIRLMQCQECFGGEAAAVVAMGDSAVLGLRELVLHGAPAPFVTRLDSALRHPADSADHVPANATIKLLLDDFDAIHRVRSSLALGLIGTDSARHAICAGMALQPPRRDVKLALDSALAHAGGACQ